MTRTIRILCVAVLTMAGMISSSLPARADDDRCERDRHRAEDKLRAAVQRHGEDSPQARKRREQLEEVKRRCGEHHEEHHDEHHDMDQPHL